MTAALVEHRHLRSKRVLCQADGSPFTRQIVQTRAKRAARKAGLRASPGGFTGELQQFGYWYGWGVRPLRVLGDDVGAVIFRMEPAR